MTRLLLRGGSVHTPADPHATTLCVEDGLVVWVGDDDGAVAYADGADRVVELGGRLVTPAFVDAHAHLAQTGFAATGIDLAPASSLAEALDIVASHALHSTAAVLLGFGWDETGWPEQRPFTRDELDRAGGGRAVFLSRVDVHSAVVSSAFLDACPDVVHAEGYDASGLVSRDAHHVAREGLFRMTPAADREAAILRSLEDAARQGIGQVHELGAPHICPPEDFDILGGLAEAVLSGERTALPETVWYWGSLVVDDARRLGCAGAAGDLCMDGSIGSRTSALLAPYADADTSGHLYVDAGQVADHVVECTQKGVQAGFHVIGDRAVAEVVEGFTTAAERVGTAEVIRARHRLEHVEMASPEQMKALGELGVVASMQPMFDALWGGDDSLYAQRLGRDRARPMNAVASMRAAGVALAFGSDSPVTAFGPWAAIRAAVWHRTESERIDARTAFDAHTRGGWLAARRDEGGFLVPGAPASVAVWDVTGPLPDPTPDDALPTCVLTLVAGNPAYEQEGALT
ncbi:amidohydrolase [soil metagenome]